MFLSNWKNKEGDIIKLEGKERFQRAHLLRETNKETTSNLWIYLRTTKNHQQKSCRAQKIEARHVEKYRTHYTSITTSPIPEHLIARGIL